MTTKVFPIQDIKELEREESFIDLWSELPKAPVKHPCEKDKERNKSKKRKHMKRDQDWEYILENHIRSKVDEELRLDELRPRAGGASSSLVPSKVGLIIGIHVVMKSETLTIIPLFVKGTSEVSLSAPTTTSSTIDDLGFTRALAPYLDSKS
ncbi:hypothetical protein H5410_030391 [Solanum commersonii]|uniref:Uncharacterized protein n=1 Tax=Solanum commersonii TaxID=4109 RepID=A0A9J5YG18_SOLCO|nr:hypothetical protein H5410_030391 [Solanum commersonii]